MVILAFDTTSPDGSAALFSGPELLGSVRSEGKSNYSVALFEMMDGLLSAAGLNLTQIELFAAATGPGSFTGIRVGLAAAQAWAKAFGRPVCGVSVLEAMVTAAGPAAPVAVPLLDARRSEFYLGVFRRGTEGSPFVLARVSQVLNAGGIANLVRSLARGGDSDVQFIARQGDQAAQDLSAGFPNSIRWSTVPPYQAEAIASVALRAAREGRLQQPEDLDACYLRRSDAEVNWRE